MIIFICFIEMALVGLTLADDTRPYDWVKNSLDDTLHVSTAYGHPPTEHDQLVMNAFILDLRFAAIVDFSFVKSIEHRIYNIFIPMIERAKAREHAFYIGYAINIQEWESKLRMLIEAIDFIKSISIMTHAITNSNVSFNADILTMEEFNAIIDTMYDNLNSTVRDEDLRVLQPRRLSLGDYDQIRAGHYLTDPIDPDASAISSTMVMAFQNQDINMVFAALQEVSDRNIASHVMYPYSNIDEQISLLNRLRTVIPFAIRRIQNAVMQLNQMPDYASMTDNELYRILARRSRVRPAFGFSGVEI